MEVRETTPTGRQVIERYGPGGFRISGTVFTTGVLILADRTLPWAAATFAEITAESLRPVAEQGGVEILLIGTGRRMQMVPRPLREALRAVGIVADSMDSSAACRTYNVLVAEERRVAAAILPIGA